jgi:hypothetical protein
MKKQIIHGETAAAKIHGTCRRRRIDRGRRQRATIAGESVENYLASATLGGTEAGRRPRSPGGASSVTRRPLRCRYSCTFLSICSSSIAAAGSPAGQALGFRARIRRATRRGGAGEEDGEARREGTGGVGGGVDLTVSWAADRRILDGLRAVCVIGRV